MNDHPPEVVRHDEGGWISGPSVTTEPVRAVDINPGDQIIVDSAAVKVTDTQHMPGRTFIGYRGATASGLLKRGHRDIIWRVTA